MPITNRQEKSRPKFCKNRHPFDIGDDEEGNRFVDIGQQAKPVRPDDAAER